MIIFVIQDLWINIGYREQRRGLGRTNQDYIGRDKVRVLDVRMSTGYLDLNETGVSVGEEIIWILF